MKYLFKNTYDVLPLEKIDRNYTTIPHLTKIYGKRSSNNQEMGEEQKKEKMQLLAIKIRLGGTKFFFTLHLQFCLPEQPLVLPSPGWAGWGAERPMSKHCSKHKAQAAAQSSFPSLPPKLLSCQMLAKNT